MNCYREAAPTWSEALCAEWRAATGVSSASYYRLRAPVAWSGSANKALEEGSADLESDNPRVLLQNAQSLILQTGLFSGGDKELAAERLQLAAGADRGLAVAPIRRHPSGVQAEIWFLTLARLHRDEGRPDSAAARDAFAAGTGSGAGTSRLRRTSWLQLG